MKRLILLFRNYLNVLYIITFYIIFKTFKNLEKYIVFSINRVYNPFYFYCILPMIDANNDCNLSKKKENNENDNN